VGLALAETYRTLDGRWLCLGAREPRSIKALLEQLGLGELAAMALGPPGGAQGPLRTALAAAFASDTLENWTARLASLAGMFGPVLTYAEALVHPHVSERRMVLTDAAGAPHLNTPIRFTREPSTPDLRIAGLGEDTVAALATKSKVHDGL
jgi:crotonobetainyl-CoA:carnitine CoA-transferase CaiB-like acyl-CoA transferase